MDAGVDADVDVDVSVDVEVDVGVDVMVFAAVDDVGGAALKGAALALSGISIAMSTATGRG
jgi:hypothetical protein